MNVKGDVIAPLTALVNHIEKDMRAADRSPAELKRMETMLVSARTVALAARKVEADEQQVRTVQQTYIEAGKRIKKEMDVCEAAAAELIERRKLIKEAEMRLSKIMLFSMGLGCVATLATVTIWAWLA